MQDDRNLMVFTGNANRPLAQAVCKDLGIRWARRWSAGSPTAK